MGSDNWSVSLPALPPPLVFPCLPREELCAAAPLSCPTAARMDLYRCSAWLSSSSDCLAIRASVSLRAGKQKLLNGGDGNVVIQCLTAELGVLLVQADFGRKSSVKNQYCAVHPVPTVMQHLHQGVGTDPGGSRFIMKMQK